MKVIVKKPVPLYQTKCPECGSIIQYKAAESRYGELICPVCNINTWASTSNPVEYETPEPPKVPRWKTARTQEDFDELYQQFKLDCTNFGPYLCAGCKYRGIGEHSCFYLYLSDLVDAVESDDNL